MRSIIFTAVLLASGLAFNTVTAQDLANQEVTISGKILELNTNRPLSYVSVGIPDKPFGTLTDTLGNFSFHIKQENISDTLQMSLLGYYSKRIAVKDFLAEKLNTISLQIQYIELSEVVVSDKKVNIETIGRQASGKFVQVSIHNKRSVAETVGSEMGMRYKTSHPSALLKDFNFNISSNNFHSIKYRVNVYAVKDNMPDTLLCKKQIFLTMDRFKTGWTKIDLEDYNIKVPQDFIVTLQWVDSKMELKEEPVTMIPVAMSLFSKNCYVRVAALDKWQKKAMNLSNFVTIGY